MMIMYISITIVSLLACGSKTATTQDTFTLDDDTGIIEPSTDTHTPTPDTQEPTDTSTPQGPPFSIFSSDPIYGPTSGGTEVYIFGEDFPTEVRVFIGTQEAQILSQSDSDILIRTPNIEIQGLYSIQIQSQEGTVSLTDAFHYYETAQDQAGILGSFDIQQHMGTYWSHIPSSFDASLAFIVPQDIHWWNLSTPAFDVCTHIDDAPSIALFPLDISAPFLSLSNSDEDVSLVWDSFYGVYEEDSSETLLQQHQSYSLSIFDGTLSGMFFPSFLSTSAPPILLHPNLDSDTPTTIHRDQTFSWEPSLSSWISLRLARLDPVSGTYTEQIRCTLLDDGTHTLAPELWNEWGPLQQVDIYFSRVMETISIAPHNLSQARIVGSYTLVGAAFSEVIED